jgi:hypothetical protein
MSAAPDSNTETVRIFVRLLDEGTEVSRPTEATRLGHGLFKILPTPEYDPGNETWEFPPGTTVRGVTLRDGDGEYLLAANADTSRNP